MTVAAIGWERIEASWWLDIAQQLIDAAAPWVESAALMDLRFWTGQVHLGRRRKLPSRRQLAARWRWTQHRVRQLLKAEGWHDPHRAPKTRPVSAQNPPTSEAINGVAPHSAAQTSPTSRPEVATRADYTLHTTHSTDQVAGAQTLPSEEKIQIESRQAEVALVAGPEATTTPTAAVSGVGAGAIWPDLVRDLERAGYSTLQQLACAGRDQVAADLMQLSERACSRRRLDRIADCLHRRELGLSSWVASGPDSPRRRGLPADDGISLERSQSRRAEAAAWEERMRSNPYMKFALKPAGAVR